MDARAKIKQVIIEAIGNPDGLPGEWKAVSFSRTNADQIAEAVFQALKNGRYLADSSNG
jgi:hypothetical protein